MHQERASRAGLTLVSLAILASVTQAQDSAPTSQADTDHPLVLSLEKYVARLTAPVSTPWTLQVRIDGLPARRTLLAKVRAGPWYRLLPDPKKLPHRGNCLEIIRATKDADSLLVSISTASQHDGGAVDGESGAGCNYWFRRAGTGWAFEQEGCWIS
jgi:hypothetical protein